VRRRSIHAAGCSVWRDTPTFSATCDTDNPSPITAITSRYLCSATLNSFMKRASRSNRSNCQKSAETIQALAWGGRGSNARPTDYRSIGLDGSAYFLSSVVPQGASLRKRMGDMDLPASVRLTSEDVDAVFVDRLQYLARGIPDRRRPDQTDSGQIAVNDDLLDIGFVVAEGLRGIAELVTHLVAERISIAIRGTGISKHYIVGEQLAHGIEVAYVEIPRPLQQRRLDVRAGGIPATGKHTDGGHRDSDKA
jgi:hypothetical protein